MSELTVQAAMAEELTKARADLAACQKACSAKDEALILAANLTTKQDCPPEHHAVVLAAMDALKPYAGQDYVPRSQLESVEKQCAAMRRTLQYLGDNCEDEVHCLAAKKACCNNADQGWVKLEWRSFSEWPELGSIVICYKNGNWEGAYVITGHSQFPDDYRWIYASDLLGGGK